SSGYCSFWEVRSRASSLTSLERLVGDSQLARRTPDMNYCTWCNGSRSRLKDPEGVDRCTRCGGSGIERTPAAPDNEKRLGHFDYERHVCRPNPIECTFCHGDGTGGVPA